MQTENNRVSAAEARAARGVFVTDDWLNSTRTYGCNRSGVDWCFFRIESLSVVFGAHPYTIQVYLRPVRLLKVYLSSRISNTHGRLQEIYQGGGGGIIKSNTKKYIKKKCILSKQ
jgi:hypothetical protein